MTVAVRASREVAPWVPLVYVTDVPTFMENAEAMISMVAADGCTSASTLLGVAALFEPSIMVELEATAVA